MAERQRASGGGPRPPARQPGVAGLGSHSVALLSAAGAGVAHESAVRLAGMPNGGYDLQVLIEEGGGGVAQTQTGLGRAGH